MPAYVRRTAPIVQGELAQLRALRRPQAHARIDRYLQKVEQTLQSARDVGSAAAAGDAAKARQAGQRTQQLTQESSALAQQLGAEACASQ